MAGSGARSLWKCVRGPFFAALAEGTVRLHVQGEAVGMCDRPLDLYALMGRFTIAYRPIQPTPAGQAFDLVYDGPVESSEIRIDLVNGAVVWYTVACTLE